MIITRETKVLFLTFLESSRHEAESDRTKKEQVKKNSAARRMYNFVDDENTVARHFSPNVSVQKRFSSSVFLDFINYIFIGEVELACTCVVCAFGKDGQHTAAGASAADADVPNDACSIVTRVTLGIRNQTRTNGMKCKVSQQTRTNEYESYS